MSNKKKTVFVLGAGFSKAAGIPTQAELLPEILKKLNNNSKITRFINDVYELDYSHPENLNSQNVIDLEDIYTPIHQSISRNEYIKGYSPANLKDIETELTFKIAEVIDKARLSIDYVEAFRDILADKKLLAPTADYFAIISLNWDIILDKLLFRSYEYESLKHKESPSNIVVDYCCHITGIDNNNKMIPGLVATTYNKIKKQNEHLNLPQTLKQNYIIFKLLKLHGSLGWGECPNCHRLFINKDEKLAIKALKRDVECRFCSDKNENKEHNKKVFLNSVLALPSFQKELEKFHFQHIWNQAAIELSEANRIVFMGYSFPLADFDFRSMIAKHVDNNTKIEVVDLNDDIENSDVGKRYIKYFGAHRTTLFGKGVADYIENNLQDAI